MHSRSYQFHVSYVSAGVSSAQVSDLLGKFRFIPTWRVDDVMVSYAPEGGSVGPHVDNYDVFLLQVWIYIAPRLNIHIYICPLLFHVSRPVVLASTMCNTEPHAHGVQQL